MSSIRKSGQRTIPRVQRVARTLTDGRTNVHWYHRGAKIRLPAPTDPSFNEAYAAAESKYREQQNHNADQVTDSSRAPAAHRPLEMSGLPNGKLRKPAEAPAVAPILPTGNGSPIYLTPEEVCERWRWRTTPETLANHRAMKIGLPYIKIGKIILYRLDLVEEYEQQHLIHPA